MIKGILVFLMIVGCTSPSRNLTSSTEVRSKPLVSTQAQSLFYADIEKKSLAFYENHKVNLSKVPPSLWQKLTREAVLQVRVAQVGMKEFYRYAAPATRTFLVTNIVSTFILPPVLTAVGQPGLAFIVLATPFEPFVAAAQVASMQLSQDLRLMRKIGWSAYQKYRSVRRELLGMPERAHVLTLIHNSLLLTLERDPRAKWIVIAEKANPRSGLFHQIGVIELENLVKKETNGDAFLEELRQANLDRDLYAFEIWALLQESPSGRQSLLELVHSRIPPGDSTLEQAISKQMHETRDLIRHLKVSTAGAVSAVKRFEKSLPWMRRGEFKKLRQSFMDISQQMIASMMNTETNLILLKARGEDVANVYDLEYAMEFIREQHFRFQRLIVDASVSQEDPKILLEKWKVMSGVELMENVLSGDCEDMLVK